MIRVWIFIFTLQEEAIIKNARQGTRTLNYKQFKIR